MLTQIVNGNKHKWTFTDTVTTLTYNGTVFWCMNTNKKMLHTVTHVREIVRMCDVNLVWFGTQNETLHTLLHNELKWYRCVMLTRMCSSKHLWLVLLCGARKDVKGNCSFKGSWLVWYLTRDKERKWIHLSKIFLSTSILWGTVDETLCACKTLAVALAEQVFTDWLAAKIWDLKTLWSGPQSVCLFSLWDWALGHASLHRLTCGRVGT